MSKNGIILVVDDEKQHADAIVESLQKQCEKVLVAYSAESALKTIRSEDLDLVITDLNLGSDLNGIDILEHAKEHNPAIAVILITAYATIDTCKEAIRRGAFDYLTKPIDIDQLRIMVQKAIPPRAAGHLSRIAEDFAFAGVMGNSQAIRSVFHILRRVAPTDLSVLIEGESGTGKELTAKALHDNSGRRNKPFKPLNCAGLTESLLESELFGHSKGAFTGATVDRQGLFQIADKGTLFLDEIGDMPLTMQAKLLRVIEDGIVTPVGSNKSIVVDVRIISATNHNLAKLVEEKKFRQDLYFRIKGVSVTLPALRNRPEDIPELFGFFLNQACKEIGANISLITEPAMAILLSYHWPGNIRQLRHVIRTMVVMCQSDRLDICDIPAEIHQIKQLAGHVAGQSYHGSGRSLDEVEKQHIVETLRGTNNNRAEAAKILKIGERTLYRKIKEYEL